MTGTAARRATATSRPAPLSRIIGASTGGCFASRVELRVLTFESRSPPWPSSSRTPPTRRVGEVDTSAVSSACIIEFKSMLAMRSALWRYASASVEREGRYVANHGILSWPTRA